MKLLVTILLSVPMISFAGGSTGTMGRSESHFRISGVTFDQLSTQVLNSKTTTPNWFSFEKEFKNFDGSITYVNPRVLAHGEMLRIYFLEFRSSTAGLCVALGKEFVNERVGENLLNEYLVGINESGKLIDVLLSQGYSISPVEQVTCR